MNSKNKHTIFKAILLYVTFAIFGGNLSLFASNNSSETIFLESDIHYSEGSQDNENNDLSEFILESEETQEEEETREHKIKQCNSVYCFSSVFEKSNFWLLYKNQVKISFALYEHITSIPLFILNEVFRL
ncbi:MAG: hypothetical protein HRT67_07065 [Flavobacteriaceae bacterium]|nr:hypothetical protein [Flavobacteriaceae bacterium]